MMDGTDWVRSQTRCIKRLGIGWMVLCFLLLTGCGGGGGGGGGTVDPATLEGMAAGGAPLVGTVTVRDAAGETLTETVALDGTFTFDVTDMTPPFVVWAAGTVNGAPATYYSTCDSDGRVNITPLTHLIMAMALGQDPADYYQNTPDAGPPGADAMQSAARMIGDLLAGMYGDLGIPASFDLMQDDFDADGTGFDRLLDMITVTVDGHGCCIAEKQSGQELLIDDNMADDNGPVVVSPVQAQAMTSGMAAAREYFQIITDAYADGVLNAAEQGQISGRLATGLIDRGRNLGQMLAGIAGGGALAPGMHFEVLSFHRLMYGAANHPLGQLGVSERGDHELGFWCSLEYSYSGGTFRSVHSFVLEDGQWKNFGNRIPLDDSQTILPLASHFVYYNGDSVQTGLALSIDDTGLRGQALGVRSVVIANDALPDIANPFGSGTIGAVIMAANDIDVSGSLFRVVTPANLAGRVHYANTDDPDLLDNLAQNSEFLHVALNANNQPIYAWTNVLFEQPYPIPLIYKNLESYFPRMVNIGSAAVRPVIPLDQLVDGPLLTWNNLADSAKYPSSARMEWWDGNNLLLTQQTYNPAYVIGNLPFRNWTSQTFLSPPGEWPQLNGRLMVSLLNRFGHAFSQGLGFTVGEPAPMTYSASLPFVSHRTLADDTQVYFGYVGLMDNGQPVDPARIESVSIIPEEGTPTVIDTLAIESQNYYRINCTGTTGCVLPPSDAPNGSLRGVQFTLPAGASFESGLYTIRTVVDGTPIEKSCPISSPNPLPVITGLQAQWAAGGALNLSWQPPEDTDIHQLIMWLSSVKPNGGIRVVSRIEVSGDGLARSQLTLPAALVANMKILKDPGNVHWSIDARSYYPIGDEYFDVRDSRSAPITISGWE